MVPNVDRYPGMCILGVQGSGKSGLLQNLIHKDMQNGHAVIVIDPHGDLVTSCLSHVPAERVADTYLLDMQDEDFPFGVNIFSTAKLTNSVETTQAVERLMHIFEVLWPDVLSQQNLPRYVRAATLTLLANPGTTLYDMQAFLQNQAYRNKLVANIADQSVKQFWHTQYDNLGEHEQYRRVQPLIGRLESLFMGRTLIRNVVGQRKSTINFRKAIEAKQIIFIKLPVKTIAQDARLIGTILLSQISNAIFSFADIPENQRPSVSLYVDEVQHFASSDFTELFTEGRKFGVRVTVAHQYRNQLPTFLQQSTMTARTKVCFQLTPEDSREMSHLFPSSESAIKPEDIEDNPVSYLLRQPSDDPDTRTFTETYLQPLQGHKRGAGRIEITNRGAPSVYDILNGGRVDHIRVADPTHQLNLLLREVMLSGNPELPLTPDIVRGFSNCGVGFYKAAMGVGPRDIILRFDTKFPRHLVVLGADGEPAWTRKPESGNEQLYHFVFHLRLVMMYLADNPIGKASTTKASDVAKMLTSLPKRAAFVRSADTIGVIYTSFRASKEVSESYLHLRHALELNDVLIAALRLKYQHPNYYLARYIHERSLKRQPYKANGTTLIPDGFLDIRDRAHNLFLPLILEHDRGTEQQEHFRRRIRAYSVFLSSGACKQQFGAERVTVAFTTFVSMQRVLLMRAWTDAELQDTPQLKGMFVFCELPRPLEPDNLLFERRWYTVANDQPIALLGE